ncbi:MAG: hypothetical protein ACFFGZ_18505 [Candidatus Thorarchaeota archaeon]
MGSMKSYSLEIVIIAILALGLGVMKTKASSNFAITERSQVEWAQVWESNVPMEKFPELRFQGDEESFLLTLDSEEKLILQIAGLNDDAGTYKAKIGTAEEETSETLHNPRIVFETYQVPIIVPLQTNLTQEVESAGLSWLSSTASRTDFKVEMNTSSYVFKLEVSYSINQHLLSGLNATWYDQDAGALSNRRFTLSDPLIKERYSEVAEPLEWIASAILLLLGIGIIFVTRMRE